MNICAQKLFNLKIFSTWLPNFPQVFKSLVLFLALKFLPFKNFQSFIETKVSRINEKKTKRHVYLKKSFLLTNKLRGKLESKKFCVFFFCWKFWGMHWSKIDIKNVIPEFNFCVLSAWKSTFKIQNWNTVLLMHD